MSEDLDDRIIERLQELADGLTVECEPVEKCGCELVTDFSVVGDAMMAIRRLRKERDEARREACLFKSRRKNGVMSPMELARLRGWDCFKEERCSTG